MKIVKILGGLITALVCIGVFGLVGRWNWYRGWAFVGLLMVGRMVSVPYLWRKTPELMKRRRQLGKGTNGERN